jgi:hypothetical protein
MHALRSRRADVAAATQVPAWLAEARAALPEHPERALALIRANRDPRVPVSPDVVELTIRALDAEKAQRGVRAQLKP